MATAMPHSRTGSTRKGFSTLLHEIRADLCPARRIASFEAWLVKQQQQPNGFDISNRAEL